MNLNRRSLLGLLLALPFVRRWGRGAKVPEYVTGVDLASGTDRTASALYYFTGDACYRIEADGSCTTIECGYKPEPSAPLVYWDECADVKPEAYERVRALLNRPDPA